MRSTSSTSRRSPTTASTTASTCATCRGGAARATTSTALTNVMTADHVWARRVHREGAPVRSATRARCVRSGFCVSVEHARFMAEQFVEAGHPRDRGLGRQPLHDERRAALDGLRDGTVQAVFTVDLFNEGVDVPDVDTLLLLRPTESPMLFLQQLGRGLRKADGKRSARCSTSSATTARSSASTVASARCSADRAPTSSARSSAGSRSCLPGATSSSTRWLRRSCCAASARRSRATGGAQVRELAALGDVALAAFLEETGLDLEDIYAGNRSWSELRRAVGLPTRAGGPGTRSRSSARSGGCSTSTTSSASRPTATCSRNSPTRRRRRARRTTSGGCCACSSARSRRSSVGDASTRRSRRSGRIRRCGPSCSRCSTFLPERVGHLTPPARAGGRAAPPARPVHADRDPRGVRRRRRREAPDVADGGALGRRRRGPTSSPSRSTRASGDFSPTTRYRDYAISPTLIHWESQSTTSATSPTGQRYINHGERGTNIVLFARLRTSDRAFWCLGPASYVSHEGERPIAFVWQLQHRLPADLFTAFAAAVA